MAPSSQLRIVGLMLLITVGWFFTMAESVSALDIDPRQQYEFAESLFHQGQYRRAAEEYQRFAFFFPDNPDRRNATFKAGLAFFKSGDTGSALQQFQELTAGDTLDNEAVEAYFMTAECHLQVNNPSQAVVQLHNLILLSDDPMIKQRAYFRIGWIHIEQTDWAAASKAFDHIPSSDRFPVDRIQRALADNDRIPRKSPALAGTLSIIPGAGQLYCGRYEDAAIAFVVNVGLIWAAVDAFDAEQYALGGLLSFVGIGFYSGNIYGAVSDAHKYNQAQQQRFIERLKHRWTLEVAPPPQAGADGILLKLKYRF